MSSPSDFQRFVVPGGRPSIEPAAGLQICGAGKTAFGIPEEVLYPHESLTWPSWGLYLHLGK